MKPKNLPVRYLLPLFASLGVVLTDLRSDAGDLLPADGSIQAAIDHYVDRKLTTANVAPAPQADDATLIRRLSLDLAGRIPTRPELRDYLGSTDPAKRETLIRRLISSRWYVHHMATVLNGMLRGLGNDGPDLRGYLVKAVHERRPWDRMFREMLGTAPDPLQPQMFVQGRLTDLDLLTRDVSTLFFGVNISCAQCHVHPYVETLTQDHFFGMKAFFTGTYAFEDRLLERRFKVPVVKYATNEGENREVGMMFLTGAKIDAPTPTVDDMTKAIEEEQRRIDELTKKNEELKKKKEQDKEAAGLSLEYPESAEHSLRAQLVETALSEQNRTMFARAMVNRVWHHFLGYGLVMRIDQMHEANPASHPELLDWLARDFIEHQYDLHRIIRGIVASQVYSRSSRPMGGERPSRELFAVANLRPLSPVQYGVSVLTCGDPIWEKSDLGTDDLDRMIVEAQTRAQQLFGEIMEQPSDDLQISAIEALTVSNDPDRLKAIGEKLVSRIVEVEGRRPQLELAVESVLSRPMTLDEAVLLTEYVVKAQADLTESQPQPAILDRQVATWQQAIWALTASAEFRFNH